MNTSEFDYQIYKLSNTFYVDYPSNKYKEILQKLDRPYNCLLLETKFDYFICIPYRTEIHHRQAFKFKKSLRSIRHDSGLDYSKMIIIKDPSYIDTATSAVVDQDEYKETVTSIEKISDDANSYLEDYINHQSGKKMMSEQEFKRRYQYTTLKYFHNELGI